MQTVGLPAIHRYSKGDQNNLGVDSNAVLEVDFVNPFPNFQFNMYMLWMLGGQLEDQRPTGWWAGFVVLTGLASNVGQAVWQPFVPFGGMSGVLYAVFGYMWIRGRQDARVALPSSTVVILSRR